MPDPFNDVEVTLRIPVPEEHRSAALVVGLQLTWTRVLAVRCHQLTVSTPGLDPGGANLRFAVLPQDSRVLPAEIELVVEYSGEVPQLRDVLWLSRKELAAAPAKALWASLRSANGPQAAHWLLSATPCKDEFKRRRQELDKRPADQAAEFFYQLDFATYVPLLAELGDPDAVPLQELGEYLEHRTLNRARSTRYGLIFERLESDEQFRRQAEVAERILHGVFSTVWPTAIQPLELHEYVRRFVNGDLFIDVGPPQTTVHGVPDGTVFFSFAEVLCLFRRLGLRWGYWRVAVPAFVTGAQVFVQLFWNGMGRSKKHYHWRSHNGCNPFSYDQWRELTAIPTRYSSINYRSHIRDEDAIEGVFSDTVAHALRDLIVLRRQTGNLVANP